MKQILMIALGFGLIVSASAQTTIAVDPPYNPDENADGVIGSNDLMGLLTVFGYDFEPDAIWVDGMSLEAYLQSLTLWISELEGQIASTTTGGFGVTDVVVNADNTLQFTFSDGTTLDTPLLIGPAGPQGEPGLAGPAGADGLPGADGATGPVGPQGEPGPAGPAGADGPQGPAGPQGEAGAPGADGPAGSAGPQGEPGAEGAAGPAGPAGATGASAYEIWQSLGNAGSPADYLAALVGQTGPQGPEGPEGEAGAAGTSAYDAWLAEGNVGSASDFLSSLEGPQGAQGEPGPAGDAGQDGASAYATWLAIGNSGTEAEFIASLVGAEGEVGPAGPQGESGLPEGTNLAPGTILIWNGSDWDYLVLLGCTDAAAVNYNPEAVINDGSCSYGPEQCGGASTVTYDGHTYDLVVIGDQCWFAENLRSEHYANGDAIPTGLSNSSWGNTTSGAVAFYNNDAGYLETYGRLYNWYAVDDSRGLCPNGWHVPTDGEWTELTDFLGGESVAGAQMKSSPSDSPSWDGTNSSGFSALPGGDRDANGYFYSVGYYGYWWSASPSGDYAWSRSLFSDSDYVYRGNYNLRNGFSVRCVRD